MAMVKKPSGKLTPMETVPKPEAKKIFSKKDLAEHVRKMGPPRYSTGGSQAVKSLGGETNPSAEGSAQLQVMAAGVKANAQRYNELKLAAERKTKALGTRSTLLDSLKLENSALNQMKEKKTPEARRIDELEARIEQTRVVTENKLHYRRQLQHMYRRLANNQITFDAHINALEQTLAHAIKEHDDVVALMRQLEAGRNKALLDHMDIQRDVTTDRRDRSKVIAVKKMEATAAQKMEEWRLDRENAAKQAAEESKGDLSPEEERALQSKLAEREAQAEALRASNQAKLHEYNMLEEQFTTIRQATGVNDLEEMVEKFIGQEGNRQTLLKEQQEVELRLVGAKRAKDEAEAKLAELKASGIGTNELNREVSDELTAEITTGRMELKTMGAACSRLEGVLVALKQGAIGLFQKLEMHRALLDSDEDAQLHATNETSATIDPVEALSLSELILGKMMESVGGGGGDTSPSRAGAGGGAINVGGDDEEGEESTAQVGPDDISSTWAALGNDDVPEAKSNTRIKTRAEVADLFDNPSEANDKKARHKVIEEHEDEEGQTSIDLVPTRDFLKLSSNRQHAEVKRREEAEIRRKKAQERYDAADDSEKELLGSVAEKKRKQRAAIDRMIVKKEQMGMPPGINPKLDAMTRSGIFLNHNPELL